MQPMPPNNLPALFQHGIKVAVIGDLRMLDSVMTAYSTDKSTADMARCFIGKKMEKFTPEEIQRTRFLISTSDLPNHYVFVGYTIKDESLSPDTERTKENSIVHFYMGADVNEQGLVKNFSEDVVEE